MDTEMQTAGIEGLAESEQRWLERRAREVRDLQEAGRRRNVKEAARIGEILAECQERLAVRGKGTFQKWVQEEFGFTPMTAYRSIRVWELSKVHNTVLQTFDLGAAYAIGVPSCPEPAKKEILKLADKGKIVTQSLAKKIIKKHKPAPEPKNDFPEGYSPSGIPSKGKGKKSGTNGGGGATVKESLPVGNATQEEAGATIRESQTVEDGEPFGDSEELASAAVNQSLTVQPTQDPEELPEVLIEEIASAVASLSRLVSRLDKASQIRGPIMRRLVEITEMVSTGEPVEGEESPTAITKPKPKPVSKKPRAIKDQVEAIYNAYPRKVAPQAAKRAIERALETPGVTFEGLLESVEEYARSRVGKDKNFTPHPATWFRRGSWEDDRAEWWRDDKPKDGWDEFEERGSSMPWLGDMIHGEGNVVA